MTSYPTTLLPSSPPYQSIDEIITHLCDICLKIHYDDKSSELERQQRFDLTMRLVEFWDKESRNESVQQR